jgi:uncharacterized protein
MAISVTKTSSSGVMPVAVHTGGQAFSSAFQQQMGDRERQDYRQRISDLFEEIREDASRLLDQRDLSVFEGYRTRIAEMMEEILHHAYLFEPVNVRDGFGRRKVFATITVVDQKLKELGDELLAENKPQLDLLGRVDEIRGLILDLFS